MNIYSGMYIEALCSKSAFWEFGALIRRMIERTIRFVAIWEK